MIGTEACRKCFHRFSGLDSDALAFKGAFETGGGPADCAGQVREGMPGVYGGDRNTFERCHQASLVPEMRWRGHVFGQRSVGSSSSALAWSWAVGRV